jgi:hypothetical protein
MNHPCIRGTTFLPLIHGLDAMCCFKHEFFAGVYLSTGTYQMQSCISGIRKTTRVDDVEVLIGGLGYEPSVYPWHHFFATDSRMRFYVVL